MWSYRSEARDFIEEVLKCQTLLRFSLSQKKGAAAKLRLNPPKEEGGGDWALSAQYEAIIRRHLCSARII
jgi:hypothetical protein